MKVGERADVEGDLASDEVVGAARRRVGGRRHFANGDMLCCFVLVCFSIWVCMVICSIAKRHAVRTHTDWAAALSAAAK